MDFDYSTETITPDNTNLLTIGGNGAFELPMGTTAQRPVTGLDNGAVRYNTTLSIIEAYVANSWEPLATGSTSITLVGDVTGSGTSPITTTLATVNSSPQTDAFRKLTVNGKGLVTATSAVGTTEITSALGYTPVDKAGDTMTGNLIMSGGGTQITLPNAPVAGTDATNKNYVDAAVSGLSWKQSVKAATTVNGALASAFENGDTIDGVTLVTGDRILIKDQTTQTENGIYVVQASGAPVRADDANDGTELVGASVFVDQGTTNADTGWVVSTDAPIVIGATNIIWAQFSGSGSYTAGTGLTLVGNSFSLTSPVDETLGGTGQTTYTVGDILYADTTSSLAKLNDVAAGRFLRSGGVSTAPAWSATTLPNSATTGDLMVATSSDTYTNLADVVTGNVLLSGGVGVAPAYGKVDLTTHVTGVLPPANGGTGVDTSSATNGQLLIGNGSGLTLATLTAGTGISITNGSGSISIAATNNGTVTSVGLALPSIFNVSGSPVTAAGTLTGTLATQTANSVFAGPTTGGAAAPTFRALVADDISGALQLYRENASSPVTPVATGTNSIALGSGSSASEDNTLAYANGRFATSGDAQTFTVNLRNTTTNATTTTLFVDGSSQRLVMPNNSCWTFKIRVVGRRTDATGGWAMYTFEGGIVRDGSAATTNLVRRSRTILDESNGNLNCDISEDTSNGALQIDVDGRAGETFRWVATVEITQVTN